MSGRGASNFTSGLLVLAMLGGAVLLGWQEAREGTFLPKGNQAPSFLMETLGGGTVRLSELKGQVVLLDFWATWCPPCREEMPDLVALAQEYQSKGVRLVAASVDDPPDAKTVVGLFARNTVPGLTPFVAFAGRVDLDAYRVRSFPTLYVLGRDGRVRVARSGQQSPRQIRAMIDEALAAEAP